MSTQIAVRLPDDLVAYIDGLVGDGSATSRAAVVSRAVECDRRRQIAARDAAVLARLGRAVTDVDGLDELAAWAARTPMPDLD